MTDVVVPIQKLGTGVVPLVRFKDMGDGTYARVVYISDGAEGAVADTDVILAVGLPIGGVQPRIRFRDMGDGTHAEIVCNGGA